MGTREAIITQLLQATGNPRGSGAEPLVGEAADRLRLLQRSSVLPRRLPVWPLALLARPQEHQAVNQAGQGHHGKCRKHHKRRSK
eukprot:GDKH01005626.1.p2 GENE.GDKH01005626.1~~GDKH01005626.1.p2  ORF type:complete len:85 (+),score=10.52 GDKH01005626.1:91-345(+)